MENSLPPSAESIATVCQWAEARHGKDNTGHSLSRANQLMAEIICTISPGSEPINPFMPQALAEKAANIAILLAPMAKNLSNKISLTAVSRSTNENAQSAATKTNLVLAFVIDRFNRECEPELLGKTLQDFYLELSRLCEMLNKPLAAEVTKQMALNRMLDKRPTSSLIRGRPADDHKDSHTEASF